MSGSQKPAAQPCQNARRLVVLQASRKGEDFAEMNETIAWPAHCHQGVAKRLKWLMLCERSSETLETFALGDVRLSACVLGSGDGF